MGLRNTEDAWGSIAKWLHWSIAFCMIAAIICSVWADQLDPDIEFHRTLWQILIMRLHKPLGFTALVLILVRVAWTLTNIRPRLPSSMPRHEVLLSKWVHFVLYALMLVVPITGWFMSQYSGSPIDYFGLFEIGNLVEENRDNIRPLHTVHVNLGLATLAIVVLHIAAAFFHEYVRKDGVLSDMLPRRRRRQPGE